MASDLDDIGHALAKYLPAGKRITAVRALCDGYSNRTFLIEGLNLILRLPPLGEPLLAAFGAHDVIGQYRIMEQLARSDGAPPVPELVLLETDPAPLGSPFFLMRKIENDHWGDFARPDWLNNASAEFRSGVSRAHVQAYANLHRLEPITAMGPARTAQEELEHWYLPVKSIAGSTLAEAFTVLIDNVPDEQAPTPCHGDAKVANILWKDGRVAALVDFEMALNGDPRWDIAALLQSMRSADGLQFLATEDENGFWGREHIASEWQRLTRHAIERLTWFEAADRLRYAALLTHGQWLFERGSNCDPRFGAYAPIAQRLGETALKLARLDSMN